VGASLMKSPMDMWKCMWSPRSLVCLRSPLVLLNYFLKLRAEHSN
jgi:hypothetical protein